MFRLGDHGLRLRTCISAGKGGNLDDKSAESNACHLEHVSWVRGASGEAAAVYGLQYVCIAHHSDAVHKITSTEDANVAYSVEWVVVREQ